MAQATIAVEVTFAWWLRPYLSCLVFFCVLHQSEPDWGRLHRVIARAIRVRC